MSSSTTAAAATGATPVKRVGIKPADWEAKLQDVAVGKGDLNRLVMDYLIIEGYREAAENFAREANLPPQSSSDFESIQNRMMIRSAIQRGDIEEAIERVNDLNPEILDNDPSLYFHLQQQRLIELIRANKVDEALTFAQEELGPRGEEHPEFLHELEETMTLLAYDVDLSAIEAAANKDKKSIGTAAVAVSGETTAEGEAGEEDKAEEEGETIPDFVTALLHPSHRQATAAQVNAAILTSQNHGPTPKLPNLLRMLAWGEGLLGEKADFPRMEMQIKGRNSEVKGSNATNEDVAMVM